MVSAAGFEPATHALKVLSPMRERVRRSDTGSHENGVGQGFGCDSTGTK
jgi:hypothetical protein